MQPTRSTRFVPTYPDNSTTIYSPFATPLPVAPSFTLPIYAILFTLLAAVPSSIHLLRRRSAPEAEEEEEEERTRAVSPLLDLNGDDLLKARQLLELGTNRFDSRQYLLSISALEEILPLACPVGDKALASECLGKSHFQLARLFSNDPKHLGESKKAFERSIRLDKTRATPRLGLGVTKYWMGDYEGAMKALETSIKRDETRSEAYEYLAKSLYRKEGSLSSSIQSHLDRALQLDPTSYSTLSFYGEILHLSGGRHNTLLAKKHLERSVELRIDQPQVHARLAFIANESLDPLLASSHFRSVLKHRQTGRKDDSCPCSLDAIQGITPFLSLYFVLSPSNHTSERISMLQTALLSYPHDELLSLLISIHTSSSELETRSNQLKNRSIRYPEDTFVKCLYALSLLAMGEMVEAEKIYQEFWKGVGGVGAPEEDKRRTAWLVMGFYEIKGAQQQKKTIECVETTPVKVKEKRIRVKVEEREESSRDLSGGRRGLLNALELSLCICFFF